MNTRNPLSARTHRAGPAYKRIPPFVGDVGNTKREFDHNEVVEFATG